MQRFTQFINTASEELANELIAPNAIFYIPGGQIHCKAHPDTSRSST
jgi:hypothetical protein